MACQWVASVSESVPQCVSGLLVCWWVGWRTRLMRRRSLETSRLMFDHVGTNRPTTKHSHSLQCNTLTHYNETQPNTLTPQPNTHETLSLAATKHSQRNSVSHSLRHPQPRRRNIETHTHCDVLTDLRPRWPLSLSQRHGTHTVGPRWRGTWPASWRETVHGPRSTANSGAAAQARILDLTPMSVIS